MEWSPLHDRMRTVIGARSFRQVGELTDTNPETARRYLQGQTPSVEFLSAVCERFGVNGEWLLTGRGPMKAGEIRRAALQESSAGELLRALATTVERLTERVERLELFVQTLEARVRARQGALEGQEEHGLQTTKAVSPEEGRQGEQAAGGGGGSGSGAGASGGQGSAAEVEVRVRRIADAVAQRPRTDDGAASSPGAG